ncbi:MAG TPA: hypothetical protein VGC58_02425 [Candidatus Paceibacterota bacterium]
MQVIPAVIPNTREQLEEEINKVSGFANLIQIDISDGLFTKIRTWPYNNRDVDFFEKLKTQEVGWPKWDNLEYEVHLMVKSPENILMDWISTGVSSVIAHIEATENFQKVVDLCRESEVSIGIAIKPSTDIEKIKPFIEKVDFVQVMGSDHLGEHGVPLDNKAVEMIKEIHRLYPEKIIAIDIGVSEETEDILVEAGATKLISG